MFGIHASEQEHQPLVARDVAAQDAQKLGLQLGKAERKLGKARIRHDADFAVFEGDGVVSVNTARGG